MPSQPLTPEDEKQRLHELSEVLKGKDLPALLKWVYDHGQLKGEFPDQAIGKEAVLKFAERAIKQRDQQKELEWQKAVIDAMKADLSNYTAKHDAGHVEWFKDFLCLFEIPSNPQKGK